MKQSITRFKKAVLVLTLVASCLGMFASIQPAQAFSIPEGCWQIWYKEGCSGCGFLWQKDRWYKKWKYGCPNGGGGTHTSRGPCPSDC